MNFAKHISLSIAVPLLFASASLQAQPIAQVVFEDPDGATVVGDNVVNVTTGMALEEGDTINTGDATVIVSFSGGSLLTIYPNSEVTLTGASGASVAMNLSRGEVLGDSCPTCEMSISTVVGSASVTGGVFGIVMNRMGGDNWTQQVRNLDGSVSFLGDPNLDVSNVAVSLIEPNMVLDIPAGEEIIIRGVYNDAAASFALTQEGMLSLLDEDVIGQMRSEAQSMASFGITEPPPAETEPPVTIEIPVDDVETASEKG